MKLRNITLYPAPLFPAAAFASFLSWPLTWGFAWLQKYWTSCSWQYAGTGHLQTVPGRDGHPGLCPLPPPSFPTVWLSEGEHKCHHAGILQFTVRHVTQRCMIIYYLSFYISINNTCQLFFFLILKMHIYWNLVFPFMVCCVFKFILEKLC